MHQYGFIVIKSFDETGYTDKGVNKILCMDKVQLDMNK